MENKYVKQFPDLMSGKKVMYVHGFGSSAQTGTVARLRNVLCNATIIAEDMPLHPQEALDLLHRLCEEEQPDLIIGTSMGGMYTEQLYGYDRIVINPAFCIADTMQQHGLTGAQTFFNPRKDGVQKFFVDNNIVKEYRLVSEQRFSGVNDEERKRVWGLFGDADTTVDTWDLFREHYPTAIHFHGEHRMDDRSYMHAVMPVIRWIDDLQEGRQRPVVLQRVFRGSRRLQQPPGDGGDPHVARTAVRRSHLQPRHLHQRQATAHGRLSHRHRSQRTIHGNGHPHWKRRLQDLG